MVFPSPNAQCALAGGLGRLLLSWAEAIQASVTTIRAANANLRIVSPGYKIGGTLWLIGRWRHKFAELVNQQNVAEQQEPRGHRPCRRSNHVGTGALAWAGAHSATRS